MTQIIRGFQLIHLARIESTNNYAAKLLEAGSVSPPAVIMADEQFAGRGQRGSTWLSEPGANLTFSLLLEGKMLPTEAFGLNMQASVALCQVLEPLLPHALVQIKWPNDVLVNRKKIAGILVENHIHSGAIQQSVVGVGLNVNQLDLGMKTATSLANLTGSKHDRTALLATFLGYWKEMNASPSTRSIAFSERLLGRTNFERYLVGETELHAKTHSIASDGALTLIDQDGALHQFRSKELIWLAD